MCASDVECRCSTLMRRFGFTRLIRLGASACHSALVNRESIRVLTVPLRMPAERGMNESEKKDWRELCAAVVNENDPRKLRSLLEELTRALDEGQSQSHVAMQTAPTDQSPAIE